MRSFVIREGRFTPAQRKNLQRFWSHYGVEPEDDPLSRFETLQPLVVEVGFGMGDSLFESALREPDLNFLGIEVHRPGVGHLLGLASAGGVRGNLRVAIGDATDVLQRLPAGSVSRVQVFFPDPWPKKRHHKRRLIQPEFVAEVAERLAPGGVLHVVTDWEPYAETIGLVLAGFPELSSVEPPDRVTTKYERRGVALGHVITDFAVRRGRTQPPATVGR